MQLIKFTLKGRPYTKKTSNRVVRCGNFTKVLPSENFINYEKDCQKQIMCMRGRDIPRGETIKNPLHVAVKYFMPSRQGYPDLTGLMQATADILQSANIIADDKQIIFWDGTRIVGIDKTNPRAEVCISVLPIAVEQSCLGF